MSDIEQLLYNTEQFGLILAVLMPIHCFGLHLA